MERVSGVSNWKLRVRREAEGITILQAATCDTAASLPDTLFGLPVTELGNHALAPGRESEEGEEVLVTCGPLGAEPEWDNRRLEELTLPSGLLRVGDYALLNCSALHTLRLHDAICYWSGGALMNCRSLRTFHITRVGEEQRESLAYFNDELSRELDVTIVDASGRTARLLFPEFLEVYEENCPAHHFDYNIYGAGYPYHHCFHQKKLSCKVYDGLWRAFLGMEHEEDAALRLAWWRLRYPVELSAGAEASYLSYLREHVPEAAAWLLSQRDVPGLRFLLERTDPDRDTLVRACDDARRAGATEALALLLEEQHRRFPAGGEKRFDL